MKRLLPLIALTATLTGCSDLNRTATKLDMMAGKVVEQKDIEFEGRLVAAQRVGSMIALEFVGGQMYNVEDTPFEFKPGDTVRVYRTYKGLEARLWKEKPDTAVKIPAGTTSLVPRPR